jgi:hypothetical protein
LKGRWALDYQGATAVDDGATIALNYHARDVYPRSAAMAT